MLRLALAPTCAIVIAVFAMYVLPAGAQPAFGGSG
jgi:hypothetical protein